MERGFTGHIFQHLGETGRITIGACLTTLHNEKSSRIKISAPGCQQNKLGKSKVVLDTKKTSTLILSKIKILIRMSSNAKWLKCKVLTFNFLRCVFMFS